MRRSARRGILLGISAMLLGSGILRVDGELAALLVQIQPVSAAPAGSDQLVHCDALPASLAEALSAREARVSLREAAVNDRDAALALSETLMGERVAEMQQVEARLRDTLALADGAAEADLSRLTAIYERMRPKDAASLFDVMEVSLVAGFLARMPPQSAAAVLAGMSADKAYAASALIAGRNALVPVQ